MLTLYNRKKDDGSGTVHKLTFSFYILILPLCLPNRKP